jgi:osmotically-inducible protein OsmY
MQENQLVGIISRANLLQALASRTSLSTQVMADDQSIRRKLVAELHNKPWGLRNVIVSDGVVHLWGAVTCEEERQALRVAAENIPGVRAVEDHTWYPESLPPSWN